MRKVLLLSLIFMFMFSSQVFSSVTTSSGSLTLDFYEDTQSGIENRWILDVTINDYDGLGGAGAAYFDLLFRNTHMDFDNQYNSDTDYYVFGHQDGARGIEIPFIGLDPPHTIPVPVGTNFLFYALPDGMNFQPNVEYEPIIGNFEIRANGEALLFSGPVGFSAVPEPMSMVLFVFGAFLLKFVTKRNQ